MPSLNAPRAVGAGASEIRCWRGRSALVRALGKVPRVFNEGLAALVDSSDENSEGCALVEWAEGYALGKTLVYFVPR